MLQRSLLGSLTLFSLSVGFVPAKAAEAPAINAASTQQAQQRNKAFLEQLRKTPRMSEKDIAKLPVEDQTKYRTMRSSLDVLIEQLEALEKEHQSLQTKVQVATAKNTELDKKIDSLRPAALQNTMNKEAAKGTANSPQPNPKPVAAQNAAPLLPTQPPISPAAKLLGGGAQTPPNPAQNAKLLSGANPATPPNPNQGAKPMTPANPLLPTGNGTIPPNFMNNPAANPNKLPPMNPSAPPAASGGAGGG